MNELHKLLKIVGIALIFHAYLYHINPIRIKPYAFLDQSFYM